MVIIELESDGLGVVDGEVVHDDDRRPCLALLLQSLERKERIDGVAAGEGLSMYQAIVDAQCSNHSNT